MKKNKKGSLSIIGAILIFIGISIFAAYISIDKSTWVTNEIQSIMDISGVTALQDSINTDALRQQILQVNGAGNVNTNTNTISVNQTQLNNIVKNNYIKELNNSLKANGDMIDSVSIKRFKTSLEKTNWGINIEAKPQLTLDATVQVILNDSYDFQDNYSIEGYDAKEGKDFSVSVTGHTNDGKVVLTVRSASRLIFK